MGRVLAALSVRQEEGRAMLAQIRSAPDKTLNEAVLNSSRVHDDTLIDLAIIHLEMAVEPERSMHLQDFMWAIDMLDHLDTLGYEIIKRWRVRP